RWQLRRNRVILMPGDSPLGYRLPLNTLPWLLTPDTQLDPISDPFATHARIATAEQVAAAQAQSAPPAKNPKADEVIHTALCMQVRDGLLYVFMLPVERMEDYFTLVSMIEATASRVG